MWYMYKLPRVLLRRDSCVSLKLFTEIGGIKKPKASEISEIRMVFVCKSRFAREIFI